jgi:arylsulfatase
LAAKARVEGLKLWISAKHVLESCHGVIVSAHEAESDPSPGGVGNAIVIFAGDNGRDTSFHAPGNRSASGPWRGGYFSTFEGNNRTAYIIRWPGKIAPRRSDEMMHITDWLPTMLNMIGHGNLVPTDRVIDGCDQSAFVTGRQEHSNRDYFPMFFDRLHVGMRYKNFKVLTHKIEDGLAPIQQLGIPHLINLTVNPDEDLPCNYEGVHSRVLYKVYGPKTRELHESLKNDSVPFGAPPRLQSLQATTQIRRRLPEALFGPDQRPARGTIRRIR